MDYIMFFSRKSSFDNHARTDNYLATMLDKQTSRATQQFLRFVIASLDQNKKTMKCYHDW